MYYKNKIEGDRTIYDGPTAPLVRKPYAPKLPALTSKRIYERYQPVTFTGYSIFEPVPSFFVFFCSH